MTTSSRKTKLLCKPLPNDVRNVLRSGVIVSTVVRCVEELVMNSIDAEARIINVGVDFSAFRVMVKDDGDGLTKKDLAVVGTRYCTSKISSLNDLVRLNTFGFRGEALASIIEYSSQVEIISKSYLNSSDASYSKKFKNGRGGEVLQITEKKLKNHGCIVIVQNLLSKVPVRQKIIDKNIELEELKTCLEYISLINPRITLTLHDETTGARIISTVPWPSSMESFKQRFARNVVVPLLQNLVPVDCIVDVFNVNGFVSKEAHSSKSLQYVYVNRRIVLKSKLHKILHHLLCNALGLNATKYSSSSSQSQQGNRKKSPQSSGAEKYPVYVVNILCPANEYDMSFDNYKNTVEFPRIDILQKALSSFVDIVKMSIEAQSKLEVEKGYGNYLKSKIQATASENHQEKCSDSVRNLFGNDATTHDLKGALHSIPAMRERKKPVNELATKKQRRDSYGQQIKTSPASELIVANPKLHPQKMAKQLLTQTGLKRLSRKPSARTPPKTYTHNIRALKRRQLSMESMSSQGASSRRENAVSSKKPKYLVEALKDYTPWNQKLQAAPSATAANGTPASRTPEHIHTNEDSENESVVSSMISRLSVTTESKSVRDFAELKSEKSTRMASQLRSTGSTCSAASFIKVTKSLDTHHITKNVADDTVKLIGDVPDYGNNAKMRILEFVQSGFDNSIIQNIRREIKKTFEYQNSLAIPNSNYFTPVTIKRPGLYTPNYIKKETGTKKALIASGQSNIETFGSHNGSNAALAIISESSNSHSRVTHQIPFTTATGFGQRVLPVVPATIPGITASTSASAGNYSSLPNNRAFDSATAWPIPNSADSSEGLSEERNQGVLLRASKQGRNKTSAQSEKRHAMFISSQDHLKSFENNELQPPFLLRTTEEENRSYIPRLTDLPSSQKSHSISNPNMNYGFTRNKNPRPDSRCRKWVETAKGMPQEIMYSLSPEPEYVGSQAQNSQRKSSSSDTCLTQTQLKSFSQLNPNVVSQEYEREPLDLPDVFSYNSQFVDQEQDSIFPVDYGGANLNQGSPFSVLQHPGVRSHIHSQRQNEWTDDLDFVPQNSVFSHPSHDPENMRKNSVSSEYFFNQDDDLKSEFNKLDQKTKTPEFFMMENLQPPQPVGTAVSPYFLEPAQPVEISNPFPLVFSPARDLPPEGSAQNTSDTSGVKIDNPSNPIGNNNNGRASSAISEPENVEAKDAQNLNSLLHPSVPTGFRSSWLKRTFPENANKFWKPEERPKKIQRIGNVELLNSGNFMVLDTISCFFAETEEELFVNKWGENYRLDKNDPSRFKLSNWDGPQMLSTELPVVNLQASEMQIWHKKVNLPIGNVSCRFTKEDLSRTIVVGNVDRKFIAAKISVRQSNLNDGGNQILVLFDQHAVHERIRLEELLDGVYEECAFLKTIASVDVTPAIEINFSDTEVRIMAAFAKEFALIGANLEIVGVNTVRLKTAPKCFAEKVMKEPTAARHELLQKLLESLLQEKVKNIMETKSTVQQLPTTILNVLKSQACSGAIKFGDELSLEASINLINALKKCKAPFQCAHGRPVLAPLLDLK